MDAGNLGRYQPLGDALRAAGKSGIDPAFCAVIEDSGNGVLSAKRAGMRCIGIKVSPNVDEDLAAFVGG